MEGLKAPASSLLTGAFKHSVSHPDELTLEFRSIHDGSSCCILTEDAESQGSKVPNGTMVEDGMSIKDNYKIKHVKV